MDRNRIFVIALVAVLLVASGTAAEQIVELDLDGILGNGPDTVAVLVGDDVPVDIWFIGDNGLLGWTAVICNPDGALEFQEVVYHTPDYWVQEPPSFPLPGCVELYSSGGIEWEPQPLHGATITYHAAVDQAIGELVVNIEMSFYLDTYLNYGPPDGSVPAFIRIGPTAADRPTWGSVKRLFR